MDSVTSYFLGTCGPAGAQIWVNYCNFCLQKTSTCGWNGDSTYNLLIHFHLFNKSVIKHILNLKFKGMLFI